LFALIHTERGISVYAVPRGKGAFLSNLELI
jgi:hypothetical protein